MTPVIGDEMPPVPVRPTADATRLLEEDRPTAEILNALADLARDVIPCHQAAVSLTAEEHNWSQVISAVSLSDKYSEYRDFDAHPTGEGITRLVCSTGESARLTQAELVAHPAWRGFGEFAKQHPPLNGWLAAPLTGSDGKNLGLIQLSDAIEGEFTPAQETVLGTLARIGSLAIERADLRVRSLKSEEQLAAALDSASEGVVLMSRDGEITLANIAITDLLGHTPRHDHDLAQLLRNTGSYEGGRAATAILEGAAFRGSIPIDNLRRFFIVIPERELDRPRVITLTDVSPLELERTQRVMLDEVVRQSPDGVIVLRPITDAAGNVVDFESQLVNDAMRTLSSRSPSAGDRLSTIFNGPVYEDVSTASKAVLTSRQPVHIEVHIADDGGQEKWFDLTISPVQTGLGITVRPITSQKLTERRLRESERLLLRSQEIAHVGGWQWTPQAGDFVTWTDEVFRIFGLVPQSLEINYTEFLNRVHPDDRDRVDKAARHTATQGVPYEIDHRILMPDGTVRHVHESGALVEEPDQPVRLIGTIQDVTERQQLDDNLNRAQRVQSLGVMAAGIAHDFNNILGVITIDSGILERRLRELGIEGHETSLESLQLATKRAADLTQRLLTFTGQQTRSVQSLNLGTVVKDLRPMLHSAVGERHAIEYEGDDDAIIRADLTQIEQVVLNVVLNSKDAMPQGGTIRLKLSGRVDHVTRWGGSPSQSGEWVTLEISDSGAGMDSATMQRIYDPFFTTKTGGRGTGLGIPVVYGIVEQSEGRMEITSSPGRGTSVLLAFPGHHDTPTADAEWSPSDVLITPNGHERVLVVEDDDEMRSTCAQALGELGYDVSTAATPGDGYRAASRSRFDVLVADVIMPVQDGVALTKSLLSQNPQMVAVLISGINSPATLPDPLRSDFLAKPFSGQQLGQGIQRLLAAQGARVGR